MRARSPLVSGRELLELPEKHLGAGRAVGEQRLEFDGRIRAQESGKSTDARVMRPPDRARAALTASARASRVRSGVLEGPAERGAPGT